MNQTNTLRVSQFLSFPAGKCFLSQGCFLFLFALSWLYLPQHLSLLLYHQNLLLFIIFALVWVFNARVVGAFDGFEEGFFLMAFMSLR